MLLRENRRRYQDGNLLVVGNGLKGGTHGNFRFSVAHIAAHEPVHREGCLHILLDFLHRTKLVGRFLKGEGGF